MLSKLDVCVDIKHLPAGDYVLPGGAIAERKTVRGFHAAVIGGTFWRQIGRLRQTARLPYVLIEGVDVDDGPLIPAAVRGAFLALTDLGIVVLHSKDAHDSALWLERLGHRRLQKPYRDRPAYAQRPKRPGGEPVAEAALACVPGISRVCARALLAHFGSLEAVVTANEAEWQRIVGIGPTRAAALETTFRAPAHN
jgi:Fanconi anemia group M protein